MRIAFRMILIALAGCSPPPPSPVTASNAEPLTLPGVENLFRVSPTLYSGGSPEGDAAFAELKKLGIRTVISVDGSTPDVAGAEKAGLRYVHLPMGYDGINRLTALKLAKAVQTLPGPVYVHCHHGKHRGPAAIAAIRLCLEPEFTPAEATAWLRQAGTDPKYQGLMNLPTTFKRPTADELAETPSEFPSKAEVPDLAKRMVRVDDHWEMLKIAKKKDWLGADSAATLLAEDFREARRLMTSGSKGEAFTLALTEAEKTANDLAAAVKANELKTAAALFDQSQSLCGKCHTKFRD
jgi:protein tyrosine phosphatase (PTP) superfamily phosphohydrolase (DUF442 family)